MDVKRILFPTDLSTLSLKALGHVRSLAEKYGAEIHLLYVGFDLQSYFPAFGEPSPEQSADFCSFEQKEAKKRLEKLCENELNGCPALSTHVEVGDPARTILAFIKSHEIDLVVIPTHGRGSASEPPPAFGGVSEKVVKGATVPVHVVNVLAT